MAHRDRDLQLRGFDRPVQAAELGDARGRVVGRRLHPAALPRCRLDAVRIGESAAALLQRVETPHERLPADERKDGIDAVRRETARRIKEKLAVANAKVLGIVLNNRSYPIPEALYTRL